MNHFRIRIFVYMKASLPLIGMFLLASLFTKAQGYCDVPNSFLFGTAPQSIDTFTVYTDTVNSYYNYPFQVKLKMAVPINDILPFAKRPLVIGVHGGGFVSDSMGPGLSTQAYLSMFNQFAAIFPNLGFATASLDYRTGFGVMNEFNFSMAIGNPGSAYCNTITPMVSQHLNNAAYRATADCRSAVDYIFKHPELFPTVDTNQIYLYGSSAGAITVLHAAFTEREEFYPDSVQLPPLAPRHKLAGILSFAGAMTDNVQSTSLHLIDASENTPIFLAHGTIDPIVPYQTGPLGECTNISGNYWWHGSESVAKRMCELDMNYELYLVDSAGHDVGSQYPVNNKLGVAAVTFIKNRGICPQPLASKQLLYSLLADTLSIDTCSAAFVNIEDVNISNLKVYPNPSNGQVNICAEDASGTLHIYNQLAQQVLSITLSKPCETIDIKAHGAGLYFYQLKEGTKSYSGRFVIE